MKRATGRADSEVEAILTPPRQSCGRPVTPLRAKYIRDLVIRGRSKHTQEAYIRYVRDLARYYRRSPHQPTPRKCEVEADVYGRKWSITHDSENESPHIRYNVFILRIYLAE